VLAALCEALAADRWQTVTALLTVWMFTPHCDGWAGWAVAMALQGRKSRWWLGRRWCAIPRTTSLLDASGQPAAAGGEECLRAQRATTEKTNSLCCVSPVEGFKASILVRHRRWLARRSLTWENVLPHYTRRAAFQTDLEAIPAAAIGPGSSCNRPAVDYAAQTGSTSTIARPLGELIIPPPSLVRRPSRPSRAAISIAIATTTARARTRNRLVAPRYRYRLHLRRIPTHSPHRTPTPRRAPPDRRRSLQGSALPAHQPRSSRSA